MSKASLLRQGTFDQPEPTVVSSEGSNPYAGTGPKTPRNTQGNDPTAGQKETGKGTSSKPRGKPVTRSNPIPGGGKGNYRKEDTAHHTGAPPQRGSPTKGSQTNTTTNNNNNTTTTTMSGDAGKEAVKDPGKERDAIEDIGKNFIDRVEKTERENAELGKENEKLRAQIDDLEKENRQLHDDNKKTHAEVVSMRDQVQDKTGQIGKLQEDLKTAQKKDQSQKLKDLQQENTHLAEKLKTTEEQDKKLLSDCNLLRKQVATLEKARDDLENDFKALKDKFNDSERQRKEKEKKLEDLHKSENTKHGNEVSKLKDEVASWEKKYKEMEQKYLTREKEMKQKADTNEDKYIQVVQELEREIVKLKEDHKRIKQERDNLLRQNEKLTKEQSERMKNMVDKEFMSELQLANKRAITQKEKLERDLNKLKREFEQYRKEVAKKESEGAFSQVKINDLTEKVKQMKMNMSSMQELLKERESHIADLRIEVNDLRNNCHAFQKELNVLRERHDDDVTYDKYNDLQSAHRKLLDENKRLRSVIARTSMEETSTASERAELRVEFDKMKEKLTKSEKRVKQMERWMDEIFNDDKFDVVLRNVAPFVGESSRGTTSFPDIAMSEPPPTGRGSKLGAGTGRKKATPRKDTYQPPGKQARRDLSPRKDTFGKQH